MNTKTSVLRPSPVNPRKAPVVRTGNALRFDNTCGARHGTYQSPMTGSLVIDPAGAVEFGLVAVVWSGTSTPSITGPAPINFSGGISSPGTHTVYLHWIDGQVNVSFFTPETPDLISPSPMSLLQTEPTSEVPGSGDSDTPSAPALLSTVPTGTSSALDTDQPSPMSLLQTAP